MTFAIHYDPCTDAAYFQFSSEAVVDSVEVTEVIVLDHDEAGRIVGMEMLGAIQHLASMLRKFA